MKLSLSAVKFYKRSILTPIPIRQMKRKRNMNIKNRGHFSCKKIRGDFLCAKEFGKELLVASPDLPCELRKEVTIEQSLQGKKVVGLLLSHINYIYDTEYGNLLFTLKHLYDDLVRSKPDAFEIILVPICKRDRPKWSYEHSLNFFNALLATMPWLSIPFEEVGWTKHLHKKHKIFDAFELVLFDDSRPHRRLLHPYAFEAFTLTYGKDFYPLTRERELELNTQYVAPFLSPNPSFEALLGPHLISFDEDGVKQLVPTSLLQDKDAVGIYLYRGMALNNDTPHPVFTKKLEEMRTLADDGKFEIVFVNLDHHHGYKSEAQFHDFLIEHPRLLALPFKDNKIRALCATLVANDYDCLAIVQIVTGDGGGKKLFADPYGAWIILDYGFDAYPFTRDSAVKIQMDNLPTQFNLTDIFKATETKFLVHHSRNNSEKENNTKPVSFLEEKRVVLYIIVTDWLADADNFRKLCDFQSKDPTLQVLFSCSPYPPNAPINMPNEWLAIPSVDGGVNYEDFIDEVIKYKLEGGYFIAFDEMGKPLNIGQLSLLNQDDTFPFDRKVFKDVFLTTKDWDIEPGFDL